MSGIGSRPSPGPRRPRSRRRPARRHDRLPEPHVERAGPIEIIQDAIAEPLVSVRRGALSRLARRDGATTAHGSVHVGDHVTVIVTDDGDPEDDGLTVSEERAGELGGSCTIAAGPSGGTLLTWQVPTPT